MRRYWLLTWAVLLRAVVIIAGERFIVAAPPSPSLTDIDYLVVVEAACAGGRPSERLTYRYTPLLAALLRPACHRRWFGKALYGVSDVLTTAICYPGTSTSTIPLRHSLLWLFNPFVVALSTRGSFDTLVQLVVAGALRFADGAAFLRAGGLLGVAVHLRLYPVVFVPFFALHASQKRGFYGFSGFVVSAVVACLLCTLVAQRFDPRFVEVGVRHHVFSRVDHRHNLSVLWPLQLRCARDGGSACFPLAPVAQVVGLACLFVHRLRRVYRIRFHRFHRFRRFHRLRRYSIAALHCDVAAAAVVFVALNSVVTAQYYAWAFFPASLGDRRPAFALIAAFGVLHVLWLRAAFVVEFGAATGKTLPLVSGGLCVVAAVIAVRLVSENDDENDENSENDEN